MATPLIVDPHDNESIAHDEVAQALRDFYLRSHRVVDRIMTERGASFARTKILFLLGQRGPLRSADLAAAHGQAPRTVTEAIDGLERDGLVRRDPDPQDRRAKRISLTEAGAAVAEEAEASRRLFVDDIFGALSVDECKEMARLIGLINARLARLGSDEPS